MIDVRSCVVVLCYSAFALYDVCSSHQVCLVDLLQISSRHRCSTRRWCGGGGSFCISY